jgi:hypothetical protein
MVSSKTCQEEGRLAKTAVSFRDKLPCAGKILPQRFDLFRDMHVFIICLAMKLPDVDFVIKPKRSYMTKDVSWCRYLIIVNEIGIDLSKLKNTQLNILLMLMSSLLLLLFLL